ncbi:MAG: hypothetical protein CBC35_04325 [Planctomycetes bacterium TMED75]|nr:metallophosphoesterase [Planctomycetaceae bacterium]OUU94201.1 MAG: hypothetical protein CBC35_04325 [Planctomycetes bacterium TMED75]
MDLSGRIFVTSDTHFGEEVICRRFGRDFATVEAMNDHLIDQINDVVGPDDILFHLGDFVGDVESSRSQIAESIRDRIQCRRIILIRGNHDPHSKQRFDRLFDSVHDILSFKFDMGTADASPVRLVLSHYPLRVWQGRHDGSLHLYGHTHGTIEEVGRSTDVGVDSWGLRPQSLGAMVDRLQKRPTAFDRIRPRGQPVRTEP